MPEPNRPHWYGRGLSLSEDLVPRINNSNAKEWMALLILQKTLSAFVELPGLLILILLAFTLFAKMSRGWRRVLSVLIVVFYLCSAGFFSQWLVAPLENHFATSYAQEVGVDASQSAIVIPAAAIAWAYRPGTAARLRMSQTERRPSGSTEGSLSIVNGRCRSS